MDLIRRVQELPCQCPTGVGVDCFFVDSVSKCPACNPTGKSGKKTTTTSKSNKFSKSAPAQPSTIAMTTTHLELEDTNKDISIDCIQSSSTSAMTKLKGVLALIAMQVAVKVTTDDNQILMLMVASALLDCPKTTEDDSSCHALVCEQIDTAVLSIETKKGRKLLGASKDTDTSPWTEPNDDFDLELLVNDPGVWAVNDFLDIEEVNKLKHLLRKYGDDVGDSPCGVPDGRKCYWFNTADGLTNNNYHDEEDHKFFMQIKAKIQDIWPQFNVRDGTGVYDVPEGKTDPYIPPYHAGVSMDTSDDKYWPATTVIYLEDGDREGGDTIFPYVGSDGLIIKPKKGMAVTWLIMHADGQVNKNHIHGFQATTPESKKKLLMTQNHYISSEELYTLLG